jgi:tricorn protease
VEVEQWPADVIAGHDPQLEKAIQKLKEDPLERLKRPRFPCG